MKVRKLNVTKLPVRQPKGRGAQFVHTALRQKILSLELRPGAKLDEAALVQSFGVSRTPVREAIIRLAADGLVFILPNRGAQVAPLDLSETAQFFEAFELNQRVVNHLAALRRTEADLDRIRRARDEFDSAVKRDDPTGLVSANFDLHMAIAQAARNTHVETTLRRLLEHGMRLCWIWYKDFPQPLVRKDMDNSCQEHDDMVAAIEARDAGRADALGKVHTDSFRVRIKDYLDQSLSSQISFPLAAKA
ncbi:MAG: GntR family transcriptional regulator [Alphaproteobacteria bacterium]|nr:GntR family transcriptional regulator [Alphaproteobacteria bacterium]